MSFFSQPGKRPNLIQPGPAPVIRKVIRTVEKPPVVKAQSAGRVNSSKPSGASYIHTRGDVPRDQASKKVRSGDSSNGLGQRKRVGKRKQSTPDVVLRSDSEDESNDDDAPEYSTKRARASTLIAPLQSSRKIRDRTESGANEIKLSNFAHSIRLVTGKTSQRYKAAFPLKTVTGTGPPELRLQYPGSSRKERFQLVYPDDPKEYRPLVDILETITQVLSFYIPSSVSEPLLDDFTGIPHELKRAAQKADLDGFLNAVDRYNRTIEDHRANGNIAATLDLKSMIPFDLAERIISQVYERVVSPAAESLRKYESFSDSTYGEILPRFASQIFHEANLKPDSVFLDLGSGVGSVVLQAALECGCEAYGIEFEETPAALASAQSAEFQARTRLWGLSAGSVRLMKGDFFSDERLGKILSRADVILVNNQAFSSTTNDKLVSLFLDVKEGARIVSLKSFVPPGYEVDERTASDPRATLDARRLDYWTGYVSWKDEGGDYFIATKDMTKLREFHDRERRATRRGATAA